MHPRDVVQSLTVLFLLHRIASEYAEKEVLLTLIFVKPTLDVEIRVKLQQMIYN